MSRFVSHPALILLLAALPLGAGSPLAIIVRPDCAVDKLTRQEAADLFMGWRRRLPSGERAIPVEQVLPEEIRSRFYQSLTQLPLPAVRAHWVRMYFTGRAEPPRQALSGDAVIEMVASHPGAVGFVEKDMVTSRVKAVLIMD